MLNYGPQNAWNNQIQSMMNQLAALQNSAPVPPVQPQQTLADLGYKMDKCCCEIKTQMLQDRLADTQNELANARDIANNSAQSAYLLSQLGKFVINAPATAG